MQHTPVLVERVVQATTRFRIEDVRWFIGGREQKSRTIVCEACGARSFNPNDVRYAYCGMCKEFLGTTAPATNVAPALEQKLGLYTLDAERNPVLMFELTPEAPCDTCGRPHAVHPYELGGHLHTYKQAPGTAEFTERVTEWAAWLDAHQRRLSVGLSEGPGYVVLTQFLGINLAVAGPPGLFETIVYFVGGRTKGPWRYDTWQDAEAGHAKVVAEMVVGA
jgi:hypothetical protein